MEKGFYTALGTPVEKDGTFCAGSMVTQVERQVAAGASGLLVMGSMGNEPYIKNSEYRKVAEISVAAARGKCPVLVGVTDVSIARVIDRIKEVSDIDGIEGVVSTIPYYSTCGQSDIYNFYTALADASRYPVYLYDLAVVTKAPIAPSTVQKLWKHPNIRGIKSGNLVTQRILKRSEDRPDNFSMIFSNIDEFDIAYCYGIDRNLDGMFSCTPKTAGKMYRALEAGDRETAGQCLDSILALRDLFLTTPSLLNAYTHAMNLLGCEGSFAIDYEGGISDDDRARVTEFMRKIGEI